MLTARHLIDQVAGFLSEAPKAFHGNGGELVDAPIEETLPGRA